VDWLAQSNAWWAALLRMGVYLTKVVVFIFVFMWIRWTLPRFRFDQLLSLAWKALVPMGLALVAWAGVLAWSGESGWMKFGPTSIWAPLGELLLLWVGMVAVKVSTRLTGRQANMPLVTVAGQV
jgi:hypothetical protein